MRQTFLQHSNQTFIAVNIKMEWQVHFFIMLDGIEANFHWNMNFKRKCDLWSRLKRIRSMRRRGRRSREAEQRLWLSPSSLLPPSDTLPVTSRWVRWIYILSKRFTFNKLPSKLYFDYRPPFPPFRQSYISVHSVVGEQTQVPRLKYIMFTSHIF